MIRKVLFVCLLLTWASEARAQAIVDERVWFSATFLQTGSDHSPWRWAFESFVRSHEGVSGVDSFAVRPVVIYRLTSHSSIGGGYAAGALYPLTGGSLTEQRIFGQYVWTGAAAGGTLTFRTRMESRFIESNGGALGRYRQQVRFSHVVRQGSRLSWVAFDELLVHLNDTLRYARGVDQNRAFGGVGVTATPSTRFELGYLNQFLPGHRHAPDRINHVLSGAMVVSF
jgi:hypothetical protein